MADKLNPHQEAVQQLQAAAKLLRPDYADKQRFDQAIKKLSQPDKVIKGELEIKRDDGSTLKVPAYRIQHDNSRGPYKGGIRFHPQVTEDEVSALATWMTWKSALIGIPFGGGKGGVAVDPHQLSLRELEELSRAYVRLIADHIGPWQDVPAPDVNTTPQIMGWMVDEWQKLHPDSLANPLATLTGKPLGMGGSEGREAATGLGGVIILEQLAKVLGWQRSQDISVAVQGFGNVGYWFAHQADERGYKIVAVSDSRGGMLVEHGLDPKRTLECKHQTGKLEQCACNEAGCSLKQGQHLTNAELLALDVDVLVPAALENVITPANADQIKAKVIIEMANGPVSPEAEAMLTKRGILVIPDVLANAGGVTTSYFEWVQNLSGEHWPLDTVLKRLQPLMEQAFARMWQTHQDQKVTPRQAVYLSAVKQVIDTLMLRGVV